MIKKKRGHVEKAHPYHVAILTRAAFDETKRVAIELAHHAHYRRAPWTGRATGFGFLHADTWRSQFSTQRSAEDFATNAKISCAARTLVSSALKNALSKLHFKRSM